MSAPVRDWRGILAEGLAALAAAPEPPSQEDHGPQDRGLALGDHQRAQLEGYVHLLQRWGTAYNLSAVKDPLDMVTLHLLDCLAVAAPLRRRLSTLEPAAWRLLDVGAGAGLPGLVLAIALPGLRVTTVDAVGKKVAFMRQAAGELGLANVHAEHARVETLKGQHWPVIASRAFASLNDFVTATRDLLSGDGCWLAMKGKVPDDEIAQLDTQLSVHVEPLQVPLLQAQRCLVWIEPGASAARHPPSRIARSE